VVVSYTIPLCPLHPTNTDRGHPRQGAAWQQAWFEMKRGWSENVRLVYAFCIGWSFFVAVSVARWWISWGWVFFIFDSKGREMEGNDDAHSKATIGYATNGMRAGPTSGSLFVSTVLYVGEGRTEDYGAEHHEEGQENEEEPDHVFDFVTIFLFAALLSFVATRLQARHAIIRHEHSEDNATDAAEGATRQQPGDQLQSQHRQEAVLCTTERLEQHASEVDRHSFVAHDSAPSLCSPGEECVSVDSLSESSVANSVADSFASLFDAVPLRRSTRRRYWARRADLKLSGWTLACGLVWEIAAEAFVEMLTHNMLVQHADEEGTTIAFEYAIAVCGILIIVLIKNRHSVARKARSVHRRRTAWQEQRHRRDPGNTNEDGRGLRSPLL